MPHLPSASLPSPAVLGLGLVITALALAGCEPSGADKPQGGARGRRAAAAAASPGAAPAPAEEAKAAEAAEAAPAAASGRPSGPTAPPDPEEELAQYANDPPGTRGATVRCQAAPPELSPRFMAAWYTYSDKDNPGSVTKGCEIGASDSILEVLAFDETDISRCAIGWEANLLPGAAYPFAGMGVRLRDGNFADSAGLILETRSSGKAVDLRAELVMREQELLQCGDERAAHFGGGVRCDGSGQWRRQELRFDKLIATWGKPPALRLDDIVALHFQSKPGHLGPIDCDFRVIGVIPR